MISSPGSRNNDPGTPTNQSNFGQSSVGTPQQIYKHPSLARIQQNIYYDSSSNRSRSNSCAPSSNVNSPGKFQQPFKEPLPHKYLPAPSGTIPIETTYAQRMKDGNTALMNPIINPEQTRLPDIFFDCPSTGSKTLRPVGFHPDLDVTREARQNKVRIHDSDSDGESVGGSWRGRSSTFDRAIYTTNHNYNFEGVEDASWVKEDPQLVPIHLDLDIGGYRLKDRIIWNLNDDYLSSNEFAAILCHDLNLPLEQFRDQISEAIDEQLDDYKEILDNEIQLNLFKTKEINGATIPITLDIHVDHLHLKDQFDWDPLSDLSPLQFARTLVADLGLGGELTLLVAHSIYDQLFEFYRQFHTMQPFLERNRDLPTEQIVYSMRRQTLTNDFTAWLSANPLISLFRDLEDIPEYTPQLSTLTAEQAEKLLMEEERKARRRRRGKGPSSGRSLRKRMY